MLYLAAADLVFVVHVVFILFVILGGIVAMAFPRVAYLHVPALIWGSLVELRGWVCPLTPLEDELRRMGGAFGYADPFIEHYILPLVYPSGLTREIQCGLGLGVIVINLVVYWITWNRWRVRPWVSDRDSSGIPR
jgi:hypothetical protein